MSCSYQLVSMCEYKLAANSQNFMEIYLVRMKILQNVLGGLLFDSHCIYVCMYLSSSSVEWFRLVDLRTMINE